MTEEEQTKAELGELRDERLAELGELLDERDRCPAKGKQQQQEESHQINLAISRFAFAFLAAKYWRRT